MRESDSYYIRIIVIVYCLFNVCYVLLLSSSSVLNNYEQLHICIYMSRILYIYCTVLKSDLRFQSDNVRDVLTFFMLRHCKAKKVRCGARFDVECHMGNIGTVKTYPACWIKQHMWGIFMGIHGDMVFGCAWKCKISSQNGSFYGEHDMITLVHWWGFPLF